MSYESPFNDPKQTAAMRSANATIISLENMVDNPSEERETGEYMVCVILAITNKGVAMKKGKMCDLEETRKQCHINK